MPFYYTKNKKGRDKMAHCENNNPVLFNLYAENKHITSDRTVFDGIIDMGGLPDSYIGVTVTVDNKGLVEIADDRAPQEGEFKVDYRHGWLYVDPDVYNGKTLNLDFYSRGIELTPASRIYTFDKNGKVDIHTTLQDYINMANNSVTFTEADTLGNIASGESFPTILGKISKWYTEKINKLKKLAFKDTVNTTEISDGAVTTNKLAKGSVTQDKIADNLAKIDSPNFSGTPTVPTPNIENNSTQIANTEYVRDAIDQYGEKQVIYTPHMSQDGTLSWTNNGGKDNPEPINLKGLKGDTGESVLDFISEHFLELRFTDIDLSTEVDADLGVIEHYYATARLYYKNSEIYSLTIDTTDQEYKYLNIVCPTGSDEYFLRLGNVETAMSFNLEGLRGSGIGDIAELQKLYIVDTIYTLK